ncbi:MAG: hypothetical protein JNK87_11885 [Bryobacterales bacterium]|nr:hypothetical protein [Bryobacterales bacterium]
MSQALCAIFAITVAAPLFAQPGRLSLVAGGVAPGEGGNARNAHLYYLGQIAVHPDGGLLVSDRWRVLRIDRNGVLTRLVGDWKRWYGAASGPGLQQGTDAGFSGGFAVDAAGNVYFSEQWVSVIRRLDPGGQLTTFAGTQSARGYAGDGGPARSAQLQSPATLAWGPDGSLFVADSENHRVRRITPGGIIETVLGSGQARSDGDGGPADKASIRSPEFIAVDGSGNLLVSDTTANTIRIVSATDGMVRVLAGTPGTPGFSGDGGPATEARLNNPGSISVGSDGRIYFADRFNLRIRRVERDGTIHTFAGGGNAADTENIPATGARLGYVSSIATSPAGALYLAETGSYRIRVVSPDGTISTFSGADSETGIGGPAPFARVTNPKAAVMDTAGNTYVAESYVIKRIDTSGRIQHYAGNPNASFALTGTAPALSANLGWLSALAVDPEGNLLVLDSGGRVLRIGADGLVRHVAGTRVPGFSGDGGPAIDAAFDNPQDLAVDSLGRIYVADRGNSRVRMIDAAGLIRTVLDGNNAGAGVVNVTPSGLAFDTNGDMLIVDADRHRVWRFVERTGALTPFASDGTCSGLTSICWPTRIAVTRSGEIYVVKDGHVTRISRDGILRELFTGTGWIPWGDNDRDRAFALSTSSLSATSNGDLLFATTTDNRVWKIQGAGPFFATPAALLFSFAQGAAAARQAISLETGDNQPRAFSISPSVPWLSVSTSEGALQPGRAANVVVTADPKGLAKGTYSGKLIVRNPEDTSQRLEIPVTMTISGTPQQMRLSQTGFAFAAIEGSTTVSAPRALQVSNTGTGIMNWRASAQTLSGGNWLQVSPATGVSDAARAAPELRVATNPAGLPAGVYFGLVTVTAEGVDNSPQSATIILNVTGRNQTPGPVTEPAGLLFTNAQGAPAPQEVQIANITTAELSYTATLSFPAGTASWAALAGPGGRIAAGATGRVEVRASAGLRAGVYTGELRITIGNEATARVVNLVLVIAEAAAGNAASDTRARAAGGCAATRLVPVFASPAASYQTTAGWPAPLTVRVVDDCAQPVTEGQVVVTFSTGDPALRLVSEGGGRWSGTWAARTASNRVTLMAQAQTLAPVLAGTGRLEVGVREDRERPVISPGGIRSLASLREGRPVAVRSPVAILGARLAAEKTESSYPLPPGLGGTSALIAGLPLRLRMADPERIEGVLPSNVADSTPLQMIVRRGNSYSVPEPVIVSEVEPAIFTADGTGLGQGMVFALAADGPRLLADIERPLVTGDRIGILCAGLGPVDRPLDDGVPAPAEGTPRALKEIVVTIQGRLAAVTSARLAEGLVGLYWVEATVPPQLQPDGNADVIVRVGERESLAVTAVVRGDP